MNAHALISPFIMHHQKVEILRRAEKCIKQKDQALLLAEISKYQLIHKIIMKIGWKKLWDQAMDHGIPIVKSMKNMVRILAYPDHANTKCPLCNTDKLNQRLLEHFITEHTKVKVKVH